MSRKKLTSGSQVSAPTLPANLIEAFEAPAGAGSDLLSEAVTQFRADRRQEVVRQVRILLDRVSSLERVMRKSEKQKGLCVAQLAAINAGQFIISSQTLQIVYNDDALNVPWDATAQW